MAVEDKFVVASDLVRVDKETAGLRRIPPHEVAPLSRLAEFERARRDIDQDLGAELHLLEHRISVVDASPIEIRIGPDVLAHRDPESDALKEQWSGRAAGFEVAGLVKDVVRGEQTLVVPGHRATADAQRG